MNWPLIAHAVKQQPLAFAGLAFVLYGIVISIAVQFIVLPYLLPGLHAGHGLLIGGDFPGLHVIASRKAAEIAAQGWMAWELQPEEQSSSGFASLVYALTRISEPWSLIPVNATLHALGGVIIMQLARLLGASALAAFFAAALYVFFPASLQWVTQIQKDSTYFAGMLAVLLGMIMLTRSASREVRFTRLLCSAGIIAVGLLLVALARLYGMELLAVCSFLLILLILPSLGKRWIAGEIASARMIFVLIALCAVPVVAKFAPKDERIPADLSLANKKPPIALAFFKDQSLLDSASASYKSENAQSITAMWLRTELLPELLERIFFRIAKARYGWQGANYQTAGSMIDREVNFWNSLDLIAYFPRALQIGLLAPFPEHWLMNGVSPGGTAMRRVTGVEMLLLYPILLIGLPVAAWKWGRKLEFWMVLVFCLPLIVLYAYTVPNLGSLYRLRYGFLMTLAAVGFSALWMNFQERLSNHRRTSNT